MRAIPEKIKLEILRLYLNGFSLREISVACKVSVGTVINSLEICQEERKEIEELREMSCSLKRNNIPLSKVVYAVHLIEMLKRYEMKLDFVTNFLEHVYIESFRFNMDIEKFFYRLSSLFNYEKENKIQLEDLIYIIEEKSGEKEKIEKEIESLYVQFGVTKEVIEEYIDNKMIIVNFMNLKNQNKLPKELEWLASARNYENVTKILSKKITTKNLYCRLNRIYHEPDKYCKLVKEIMKIEV